MKKILAAVLVLTLALTVVACGKAPSSSSTTTSASTPESISTPTSTPVEVVKYERPADFTKQGYGEVWYPETESITMVYHPAVKTIADLLTKDMAWPTELTDEWKGWGYSDIHMTAGNFSSRTSATKDFVAKHTDQVKNHVEAMKTACPNIEFTLTGSSANGVPYSELKVAADTDLLKVKEAVYEALYLQAWTLIPEEFQGVTVMVGDKAYTVDELLAA